MQDSELTLQETQPIPITQSERIQVIDVIRGIAIFGILLINITSFSSPEGIIYFEDSLYPDLMNQSVSWFMKIFIEGKFYSIFSFLFGLGMAVQYERFKTQNIKFTPYFSRRLLVLLGIGLLHDLFLWPGQILIDYALLGFILLALQSRKQKTIKTWIFSLFIIPVILALGIITVTELTKEEPVQIIQQKELDKKLEGRQLKYDEQIELYQNGTYLDQFQSRIKKLLSTLGTLIGLGWYLLGMFLIGVWSWRKGIFKDIQKHKSTLKKGLWLGLVFGIFFNGLYLVVHLTSGEDPSGWDKLLSATSKIIYGNLAFSVFYICTFTLVLNKIKNSKLIQATVAVGKTALSNYLFQTIICTTLFYSYGFALYGKTGPALNFLIVLILFPSQLILSQWWIKNYRFGPVEWLWRSLTYRKLQPMRIHRINSTD